MLFSIDAVSPPATGLGKPACKGQHGSMNPKLVSTLLVATLLIVWVGWSRLETNPIAEPASDAEVVPVDPSAAEPPSSTSARILDNATADPSLGVLAGDSEALSQDARIERAQVELDTARAELDRLDAELAAIEAEVDQIEADGLNPVDFAEEGMARLQPVLQAYLDAQVRYDAALKALAAEGVTLPRQGTPE